MNHADMPQCLLHTCCAPCVTHSWQVLRNLYKVTIYFYNPNIHPVKEYKLRVNEIKELGEKWGFPVVTGTYDKEQWFAAVKGLETVPEGGSRCLICYRMRFEHTARMALKLKIPSITTTLTISPHKKSQQIFTIGHEVAEQYGLEFIEMDFKKKDGFRESCQLSREEGLYRQDYCGCIYSRMEAEQRRKNNKK
ncbi:epoxyqueuosine reductase QueH [bacterium]|nr:epoxyqueuosine reductase QueH [bacterium]